MGTSSDPDVHRRRLKAMRELGATTGVMMNVPGADPHGALRVYGGEVPVGRLEQPGEEDRVRAVEVRGHVVGGDVHAREGGLVP